MWPMQRANAQSESWLSRITTSTGRLFCDVLKSANGLRSRAVADGELVLNKARAFAPDLVIMDIQLPNISGLDLIAAAKRDKILRSRIPRCLPSPPMPGKGDEERIRDARSRGLPGQARVDRTVHGRGERLCSNSRQSACRHGLELAKVINRERTGQSEELSDRQARDYLEIS